MVANTRGNVIFFTLKNNQNEMIDYYHKTL